MYSTKHEELGRMFSKITFLIISSEENDNFSILDRNLTKVLRTMWIRILVRRKQFLKIYLGDERMKIPVKVMSRIKY
jgi:hypothetical protein